MTATCRLVVLLTVLICPASIARAWVSDLLVDELTRTDGVEGSYVSFGYSISLSGDMAVVGAPGDDENGYHSGSAYIFQNGPAGWAEVARLLPDDGAVGDWFGGSVGIDGNTVVIGAPKFRGSSLPGAAYVFKDTAEGWSQVAKFVSDADPEGYRPGYQFGYSVGVSDGTVLIGSPYEDYYSYMGAAYVFEDEGSAWTHRETLLPDNWDGGDLFGWSVDISGDRAIVGAPGIGYDKKGSKNIVSDSAYIFERDDSAWTQAAKVGFEDTGRHERFGWSVAIDGNKAIVGALEGVNGAAHFFEDDGSGWQAVDTFLSTDVYYVSISDDRALVGDSSEGVVWLFEEGDSGWEKTDLLVSSESIFLPVAIDGNTALVGGRAGSNPDLPGAVYVFALPAPIPEPSSILLLLTAACCALIWRRRR